MNTPEIPDERLSELLRAGRPSPALPPRFADGVWRRIENDEAPAVTGFDFPWLENLVTWVLRPRFAATLGIVLLLVGSWFGVVQGVSAAKQEAQARYLAVVAPSSLR